MGAVFQQQTQNVELTNFTEAMYSARESAMARMQESALTLGGTGVVEVKVVEGPMSFATHAIKFVRGDGCSPGGVVAPVGPAHDRGLSQ